MAIQTGETTLPVRADDWKKRRPKHFGNDECNALYYLSEILTTVFLKNFSPRKKSRRETNRGNRFQPRLSVFYCAYGRSISLSLQFFSGLRFANVSRSNINLKNVRESMKRPKTIVAGLVVAILVTSTFAPVAFAQQPARGDWSIVRSVGADENLLIRLKDGKKISGKFSSANDSELTIIRKGRQQVIPKDSIAQVHHSKRKAEKAKYAAIGAGIGAGAGAAIGGAKANSTSDDGYVYTIVGVIFGAGFGALGGLLWGSAKQKHVLIYEAP